MVVSQVASHPLRATGRQTAYPQGGNGGHAAARTRDLLHVKQVL